MLEDIYPISNPPQLSEDTMLFLDEMKSRKNKISTPTNSLDMKWNLPPEPPKRQVITRHAD